MLHGNLIQVLIIDDDEDDFEIISALIESIEGRRFQLEWCNNYASALEKLTENKHHIYFVDYRLGNQTGLDVLEYASHLPTYCPIILLTGKGNQAIDIEAMKRGATDYLVKSDLNKEKLERCIRYSLDRANSLRALISSESKYRDLFETSKDALFIADENLNFKEINSAACELFCMNKEELLQKNLFHFIPVQSESDHIKTLLPANGNIAELEIQVEDCKQQSKACLLSISVQTNAENNPFLHGIIHDITNLKNAEKLNIQTEKLAANERLVRILAHEIRNPLNNISLSADHLKIPGEKEKVLVSIIQRNSIRINQIITELLDSTRLVDLVFEKQSIQEIIDESLATAIDRITLLQIKLAKQFPAAPLEVIADRSKLKIAFSNIFINALEAMEPGKGELAISVDDADGWVIVSVQDNGKGIPKEFLAKLFEPFFTMKKNGMGLGLSAAYSIIKSHKGSMKVESTPDIGTTFFIRFEKASL